GSTLKPFVVAANAAAGRRLPSIPPQPSSPELGTQWACGDALPTSMTASEALARSCNGWFLALEQRLGKDASDLGGFGDMLVGLGLNRQPADMSEVIGLRTSLTLSPRGLA